jgi:hypothetical protein
LVSGKEEKRPRRSTEQSETSRGRGPSRNTRSWWLWTSRTPSTRHGTPDSCSYWPAWLSRRSGAGHRGLSAGSQRHFRRGDGRDVRRLPAGVVFGAHLDMDEARAEEDEEDDVTIEVQAFADDQLVLITASSRHRGTGYGRRASRGPRHTNWRTPPRRRPRSSFQPNLARSVSGRTGGRSSGRTRGFARGRRGSTSASL